MKVRIIAVTVVAALLLASSSSPYMLASQAVGDGTANDHAVNQSQEVKATAKNNDDAPASSHMKSVKSGWTKVAESDSLILHIDVASGELTVTEKASGAVWSSNPPARESDELAKGVKKMDLGSQLLIDYIDDLGKPFQANSLTGSVKEAAPEVRAIDGGVEIVFSFPQVEFSIPVRYTIEDDAFSAMIVTADIKQGSKYKLVNISLLPFFGAGDLKEDGYLFVPDGSGALIYFNNGKSSYRSYNERVYGGEAALDLPTKAEVKQAIRLPVFGLKKGDQAYVAVIAQGEYQAGIVGDTSGKNNSYNNVYSYLNLTEIESNLLLEGSLNEKQVTRSSASMTGDVPLEVRYYFLQAEQDPTYVGMAHRYKQYLLDKYEERHSDDQEFTATESSLPLLIDFVGGAKKRETFLGIPYNTVEALTSFKDISLITDQLLSEGINLSVRMQGWSDGGAKGEVPVSLDAESKLGGNKGLLQLGEELADKGVAFYPSVNPVYLYESGNGFSKFSDTVRSISRAPALKYEYRLSDRSKNKTASRWYLMKPSSVAEAVDRYTTAAMKRSFGAVSFEAIGSMVYSDFKKDSSSKNETGEVWQQALKQAADNMEALAFDKANAYTFPHAAMLTGVPLYDSGFDVTDETVPFYSIVTSGWIPTYSEPINLSSMPRDYLLKLIETGTFPAYQFIASNSAKLTGTEFDWLYSGDYSAWQQVMLDQYEELDAIMEDYQGSSIMSHQKLLTGVYETTFENGASVIVNYNDEAVNVQETEIPANGYLKR
ncbi:DUF5696 domain-containing protein [Paenibacillus camelliae]|uniref:DUF5696 domain-containing protein n=1 Tax=Paenibacillus camelliae TaxID=512410 RepID=UPI00203FEBD9|nr:DUF5696 domain-containing protein [Paenibacillus camelliae]MCM3632115.1 DUF5696 domain-containing protein [Paenibacillus camelliae]